MGTNSGVWESPRVRAILEQPMGTAIDLSVLTEKEREQLLSDARGMWADHTEIKDSVKWVRRMRKGLSDSPKEEL